MSPMRFSCRTHKRKVIECSLLCMPTARARTLLTTFGFTSSRGAVRIMSRTHKNRINACWRPVQIWAQKRNERETKKSAQESNTTQRRRSTCATESVECSSDTLRAIPNIAAKPFTSWDLSDHLCGAETCAVLAGSLTHLERKSSVRRDAHNLHNSLLSITRERGRVLCGCSVLCLCKHTCALWPESYILTHYYRMYIHSILITSIITCIIWERPRLL